MSLKARLRSYSSEKMKPKNDVPAQHVHLSPAGRTIEENATPDIEEQGEITDMASMGKLLQSLIKSVNGMKQDLVELKSNKSDISSVTDTMLKC